ncbi:ADAMTS17, partial [Symbiodinium pilosum]
AGICPGEGPAQIQSCVNTSGCSWQLGEWSNCSTSCGSGVRSRTLHCPAGSAQDCGVAPASYETCSDTTGCTWQVGAWSSCDGSGCGQRVRAVFCDSGQDEDCLASRPVNISTCDLEVCLAPAAESASFDVVLEVSNETSASQLEDSLQNAVAESLDVPVEAVSVQLVENGRRLAASQMLQFIVEVRSVSRGLAEFLSSETSLQAVAVDVAQELTQTGIPADVQMVARAPTTTTTAPPTTSLLLESTAEATSTAAAGTASTITSQATSTAAGGAAVSVTTSQAQDTNQNFSALPGLIK